VININNRKIIAGIGQFAGVPDDLLGGLYRSIDKLDKIGLDGVKAELRKTGLEDAFAILRRAGVEDEVQVDLVEPLRSGDLDSVQARLRQTDVEEGALVDVMDQLTVMGLADRATITDDVIGRLLEFLQIGGSNQMILAQLRDWLDDFLEALEGVAELEEMIEYLGALGVPEAVCPVVPSMVRGLEYYTGPIYETFVEGLKIGSIAGGGRYDELVGMFANRSIPATGTALGFERIVDVMEELEMFPPEVGTTVTQVLVTQFNSEMVNESLKVAGELRRAGINTEFYFESKPLGKQIRYALQKGIPFVVILGPDEVAEGKVTIRNLGLEQQEVVPREQAVAQIRAWQQADG
jgi:histidyl-tRNA synthetase